MGGIEFAGLWGGFWFADGSTRREGIVDGGEESWGKSAWIQGGEKHVCCPWFLTLAKTHMRAKPMPFASTTTHGQLVCTSVADMSSMIVSRRQLITLVHQKTNYWLVGFGPPIIVEGGGALSPES